MISSTKNDYKTKRKWKPYNTWTLSTNSEGWNVWNLIRSPTSAIFSASQIMIFTAGFWFIIMLFLVFFYYRRIDIILFIILVFSFFHFITFIFLIFFVPPPPLLSFSPLVSFISSPSLHSTFFPFFVLKFSHLCFPKFPLLSCE